MEPKVAASAGPWKAITLNKTVKSVLLFGLAAFVFMFFLRFGERAAEQSAGLGFAIMAIGFVSGAGVVYWNLSGNSKTETATPAELQQALAMTPAAGKAAIYLVRKGFVAKLQGIDFTIEGVGGGQAKGNQFLHAEAAPGTYHIAASAKGSAGSTDVTLAEGEIAIFRIAVVMGMTAGTVAFTRLDVQAGRAELASAKMVRWTATV